MGCVLEEMVVKHVGQYGGNNEGKVFGRHVGERVAAHYMAEHVLGIVLTCRQTFWVAAHVGNCSGQCVGLQGISKSPSSLRQGISNNILGVVQGISQTVFAICSLLHARACRTNPSRP